MNDVLMACWVVFLGDLTFESGQIARAYGSEYFRSIYLHEMDQSAVAVRRCLTASINDSSGSL
jgi:hypothetical protein